MKTTKEELAQLEAAIERRGKFLHNLKGAAQRNIDVYGERLIKNVREVQSQTLHDQKVLRMTKIVRESYLLIQEIDKELGGHYE